MRDLTGVWEVSVENVDWRKCFYCQLHICGLRSRSVDRTVVGLVLHLLRILLLMKSLWTFFWNMHWDL